MDSSTFDENQTQFSVFTDPAANSNDQPVDYGPLGFKVMRALSQRLGGVEYLIGESEVVSLSLARHLNARKTTTTTRLELADTHRPHDLQTRSECTIHFGRRAGRVPSRKRKRFNSSVVPRIILVTCRRAIN